MTRPETPWNELPDAQREAWLGELNEADMRAEWLQCSESAAYFIDQYVQIYDKVEKRWLSFHLWPAQYLVLKRLLAHLLVVVLKARQLGLSWLALAYHGLWKALFRPIAKVGIFSRRDDEAQYLLGEERLKGMYNRLPPFLRAKAVLKSDGHVLAFSNGSVIRAYPTSAGDSYALTDVILDEYDLVPDQSRLMNSVKPTIDGGGQMTMISRVDKSRPQTPFKQIYRAARRGRNEWHAIFLPWHAHPERDREWYVRTKNDIFENTGSLDDLYEQYPETDEEALSSKTLGKRIPPGWLKRCYHPEKARECRGAPAVPELEVFRPPEPGQHYAVGVDPAEGNPTSDDSAIEVVYRDTGEEACALASKFEPGTTAFHAHRLAQWYNNAPIMVERNNHGHAVLLWLKDNSPLRVLRGEDHKPGWLDNTRGKALLYDNGAELFRDGRTVVHSEMTYLQIASIEGSTLHAPEGEYDDRATAMMLALLACRRKIEQRKATSHEG
ncbi:MAG TPA: hypothetical protein VM537_00640 [Anaerolineae bacterium]|nr:hypothetical protein [Anaerolineae bacterium]